MGLFGHFRKKQEEEPQGYPYKGLTVDEALSFTTPETIVTPENVASMTRSLCEQINGYRALQNETKHEYGIVTQYLADIQRIESMNEKDRGELTDAARMIMGLDDERYRYQNSERKIPAEQHRCMAMYEDDIPRRLREIKKQEEYLGLVKEDMRRIEEESNGIAAEAARARSRIGFLGRVAYAVLGTALFIFILLMMLMNSFGDEFMFAFFITGAATIAFIAFYVVENGNLRNTVKLCERKQNRATQLMNKIKIKYVSTTSSLDYSYEKYHVSGSPELATIWEEYVREKDEEARYRRNTEMLNSYQEELEKRLINAGVEKPDAWVYAPEALVSRTDMDIYKEGIGRRRRKLRAQIDFSNRQQEGLFNDIDTLRKKYPDFCNVIDKTVAENTEV